MAAQSDRAVIDAYGDGGFSISGAPHRGSIFLLPGAVIAWPVTAFGDIRAEQFDPVLAHGQAIDILLVGCGARMQAIAPDLAASLRSHSIAVEAMDTGAACRVFNVLAAEGRRVAAALIAV